MKHGNRQGEWGIQTEIGECKPARGTNQHEVDEKIKKCFWTENEFPSPCGSENISAAKAATLLVFQTGGNKSPNRRCPPEKRGTIFPDGRRPLHQVLHWKSVARSTVLKIRISIGHAIYPYDSRSLTLHTHGESVIPTEHNNIFMCSVVISAPASARPRKEPTRAHGAFLLIG